MSSNGTTCPVCGAYALFFDGTFQFDANGAMSVLSGPRMTHDILRQLRALVDDAVSGEVAEDEVIARIEKLDKKVSDYVSAQRRENGLPNKVLWLVISAILGVLLTLAAERAIAALDDDDAQDRIRRAVDDVLQQYLPNATSTTSPTSAPPRMRPPTSVTSKAPRTPPATPGGPNRAERRAAVRRKPKRQ